ncbi:MAG: TolC family protein [Candidatus Aminicenantes bacterium]|nr:TolC family protein [Candidatus Aminicenantes bacterium]
MTRHVPKIILVLALGAGTAALAQDRMTLKEAAEFLLKNSEQVQIAQESVVGAELKISETKSLYWPQVNVAGSYMRMSLVSEMSMQFLGQTYNFRFGLPNNYNMQASVAEQVFNWGRTARMVEMNTAGWNLAQDGVLLAKHSLSYQVVPIYYGTLFFREAIKVLDDNLRTFEKKRDIMSQRYQAGLASSFDRDLIQVQISGLQAQKLDFENNIHKFQIMFNALSGRDEKAPFDPAASLAFEPENFDQAALLQEALANRVEFQQVQHQLNLGRASRDLAKTADKPTVAAVVNYQFRNGFMPDMEKIKGNWTATLSVAYPVFDGRRTAAQVAQAESNLRAVEMRKTDQERTVTIEIQSGLADLKTIEQKLEIEKVKIKQAEDALRIADERYQNGLLNATDLIDTQNALESARLNLLQLIYNHTLSKFNLFRSCGRKI